MILTLILGFIWYEIIAVFGISAGIHRYFSHKQFKAGPLYEWIALYMVTLAGARSPIGWVGAHRIHHLYADTEKDPHSPDYQGWLKILIATSVITFAIHWQVFVGFVMIPYVLGFIGYGLFNFLGHKDHKPRNNWIINILAVGEGFHEPHHENTRKIRLHKWDITGWVIETLFTPVKKQ